MTWTLPVLVALQLRERPTYRTCHYCDAELALDPERDVVVAPWGAIYVKPGLLLPTTDHKIPVSRGGTNDLDNLVLSCISCNSSKGGREPDEWFDARAAVGEFAERSDLEMMYGSSYLFERMLREAGV